MIEIVLLDLNLREAVKEIFFLSSSIQTFSSSERKEAFFKRWCEDYMTHYHNQFYVMRESDTKKVLGYLSGCDNSLASLEKMAIPGPEHFKDLFERYPAHFHINFHPDSRGRGLGRQLVDYYCQELSKKQIQGVHIITSVEANNVSFYLRLNFTNQKTQVLGKTELLFMGLKLC